MNTAIFTLELNTNYGGLLQAYALQEILKEIVPEQSVCVIDSKKKWHIPMTWKLPFRLAKRCIKKVLGRQDIIFVERRIRKEWPVISQNTEQFVQTYISRRKITSFRQLNRNDINYFIVGSDQVWRPGYAWQGRVETSFLSFAEDWQVKRIAYAASFGTDEWEYTDAQTKKCSRLLQKFDAVSVRESSGIELCAKYLKRFDVFHALDPTMLLDVSEYKALFDKAKTPASDGNLLIYILDETAEKERIIHSVSQNLKLNPFYVGVKTESLKVPPEQRIYPPVESWLRGFYDAEFVVTDSFHGCVFSILFKKPFIVYGNEKRGMARFDSLLDLFELKSRLIIGAVKEEQIREIMEEQIDYSLVYEILNREREKSMDFLRKALLE